MGGTWDSVPEKTLDDVAYLARSKNRIELLEAVIAKPRTRRELREETVVTRATVARIMDELDERGWVERGPDGKYAPTSTGEHVVAEFRPFVESMTAIRRLGEAIDWLPVDELDIELRHFVDATVVHPTNDDPTVAVDMIAEKLAETTEFRGLTQFAPPDPLTKILKEGLATCQLRLEVVITAELFEYFQQVPARREQWRELLDDGAELYRYDDAIPCNVWIMDDTTLVKKSGTGARERSYGIPIVTQNETVHDWAGDLIETYRNRATPVGVGDFDELEDTTRNGTDAAEES